MNSSETHETEKAEITAIYHENKVRCGYRRITTELRNRKIHLNRKMVRRLIKELGFVCRVRMKKITLTRAK
ncbi:MAG: transposase [Clostridia bacterium]|nr:transposase [Clostridia bacterium]